MPTKFFYTKIYHTKVSLHKNFQIYGILMLLPCPLGQHSQRRLSLVLVIISVQALDHVVLYANHVKIISIWNDMECIITQIQIRTIMYLDDESLGA